VPPARAPQGVLDRADVEGAPALGFLQRLGEMLLRDDAGEVDERASDARRRDARDGGGISAPVEDGRAVELELRRAPRPRRRRDVRAPVVPGRPEAVEGGGVAVAQQRAGPGRQDGCHPVAVAGEAVVADGVHTVVEPDQAPACRPRLDHRVGEAGCQQLPASHHPVLCRRQAGQHRVRMMNVRLWSLSDRKVTLIRHRRHPGSPGHAAGAWNVPNVRGGGGVSDVSGDYVAGATASHASASAHQPSWMRSSAHSRS
jgi:hypothetical protein